jgi:Mrp family chromosome partitioning ATPase/capsular polysaccharide biosynthesis protein
MTGCGLAAPRQTGYKLGVAAQNRAFGGADDEGQIDVTHIARVLAANARLIGAAALVVAAIVFFLSHGADSRYRATARIVADTTTTAATTADTDPRRLATNVALLTTPDVLDAAARTLPGETGASLGAKVSSTAATDADVITVTASDASADAAAAAANAVARAFLERRTANERAAILRTRAALTAQLAAVGRGPSASAQAADIRTRLSGLVVDEANAGNDLQLAQAAEPPSGPYAPRPLRNAVLAFLATLFVAALAVLLRDRLRPQARGEGEIARASGVPMIGTLAPRGARRPADTRLDGVARRLRSGADAAPTGLRRLLLAPMSKRESARAARTERARAAAGDGVRSLLGAVLLALPPGDRHVILVTSATRGQGSARVVASLARALAKTGQETLAVSADPSSSELAAAFGVAPSPGLTEALDRAQAGSGVRLRAATVPGLDTLHVVPAGAPADDGVGLVRPGAVDALFAALGHTGYGYVIVDAPGLLTSPEASLVARHAEAAIIACAQRPTPDELTACRRALERLDVHVLGAVGSERAPAPQAPRRESAPRRIEFPATHAEPSPSASGPVRQLVEAERLDEVAMANGGGVGGVEAGVIIERLRMAGKPLTFSQLRDALGDPAASSMRSRLRQLVEGGDVVRGGSGRRGDPYVYGLNDR